MLPRYLTPLLVICALSGAANAQECAPRVERWGERGVSRDFATDGRFVYAADGRGVATYDAAEPKLIREVSVTHTTHPAQALRFAGERLVVASGSHLELFDVAEGRLTRSSELAAGATLLTTSGDRIAAVAHNELTIVRAAGSQLVKERVIRTAKPINAVLWSGDLLFIAEHETAVRVFDTTGSEPRQIGLVPVPAYAMLRRANRLFIAAGGGGVITVDLTDPARPRSLSNVDGGVGDFRLITISGDTLYVADGNKLLRAYQINAAADGVTPGGVIDQPIDALLASGDSLYLAGTLRDKARFLNETGSPLRIFDATTLTLRGECLTRAGGITGVATDGTFAYLADPPQLRVLDLRTSPAREVATVTYGDTSDKVKVNGQWAIVYGRLEAHIIDIKNPLEPHYAGVFHTLGAAPNDVGFTGPYLLEANRASGFHVLDITNPMIPHQISGLKNDGRGQWFGMAAMTGHVYGMVVGGIRVLDLRNPHVPAETTFIRTGALIDSVVVRPDSPDALLAVADWIRLRIFSLADPTAPVEINEVIVENIKDLVAEGALVHVLQLDGRVTSIDLSDPLRPSVTERAYGFFAPSQIAAAGRLLVADRYALHIIDSERSAAAVPAPVVTVSPTALAARLTWEPVASEYEVEISSSSAFGGAAKSRTRGGDIVVSLDAAKFVRVRALTACSTGEWSQPLALPARSTGVTFESAGQIHYVTDHASLPTPTIAVRNRGTGAESVVVSADDEALLAEPLSSVTLAPGESATLPLKLSDAARSGGDITFRLNGGSGATHSLKIRRLTLAQPRPRVERPALVLPGAGSLAGVNNTRWRSDLQILCNGGCELEVAFAPVDAPATEHALTLTMMDGELAVLRDIVALLGLQETTGLIAIYSSGLERLKASLYTYNDSASGKFGQRIEARRVDAATLPGASTQLLLGIASHAASRTNLGLVNVTARERYATVHLRESDGTEIAQQRFGLAPFSTLQVPASSITAIELSGAHATVEADEGVISYSSRVDQKTGDATFSYGAALRAPQTRMPLTRAATFPLGGIVKGDRDSVWMTDIELANMSDEAARFRLAFIPIAAPHNALFAETTIAPRTVLRSTPSELFDELQSGQLGSIRVESSAAFIGWSRLYNVSEAGTYGQYVPLRSTSRAIPASHAIATRERAETMRQLFPVAESAEERTNLTIVEREGSPAAVTLAVYDATGAVLGVATQQLRPFDTLFVNRFIATLGISGVTAGRIDVITGDANVDVVGSVVQVKTNDAVTLTSD